MSLTPSLQLVQLLGAAPVSQNTLELDLLKKVARECARSGKMKKTFDVQRIVSVMHQQIYQTSSKHKPNFVLFCIISSPPPPLLSNATEVPNIMQTLWFLSLCCDAISTEIHSHSVLGSDVSKAIVSAAQNASAQVPFRPQPLHPRPSARALAP
jgi:hypothetical protein